MFSYAFLASAIALVASVAPASVQAQQMNGTSDSDYIAKVMAAAPAPVVKSATIVEMQKDGTMRTVQSGTNGFTCMLLDATTPMCGDKNAMDWMHACNAAA